MAARKKPTGWVQDIAPPRSLFLRRKVAKEAIDEFKRHATWGREFLPIFEFAAYPGQAAFENLFGPCLHEPLIAFLKNGAVYPTRSGGYVKAEQTVHADEDLGGLLSDEDLRLLFPNRSDLRFADASVDVKTVPEPLRDLVKTVTFGQVARNKTLLLQKLKQSDGPTWFNRLYSVMAQSGQDFTSIQGRDYRGRITYMVSPIYMLTDKNTLVLSSAAYLREVPDAVLKLREQFPAVDRALSTYQHIHPVLDTPELAQFFKDRTHVQSVDFDKICRDIFLPKLTTNVAPLPRDELIGYTRLLQKGPAVSQNIWVLTKSGNIKQSDQVFFGKEYFPAEDWERNSTYCPQFDFLSSDYLQGVAQTEFPSWKEFFKQTGVKERADNPHVRDFAVAFVRQQMASELSNFVSKEHQQHGYDLEARRLTDNAIVCLEVKGQKKEGPVELDGNEPTAAKQAKQKNQPFWLCVVPGIPEQPQLWVIDDPLTAGEFKTVTIDSSRWKNSGRRVA